MNLIVSRLMLEYDREALKCILGSIYTNRNKLCTFYIVTQILHLSVVPASRHDLSRRRGQLRVRSISRQNMATGSSFCRMQLPSR
jgi:hypothetical protein